MMRISRARGFTLIELLVVIAIAAILAAIAYPIYTHYIETSRRSAAITALQRAAAQEEKYYATHNTYASLASIGYGSNSVEIPSADENWYTLAAPSASATGYVITATPVSGGPQAKDDCGTYKLDSTGARSVVSASKSASDCWGSG